VKANEVFTLIDVAHSTDENSQKIFPDLAVNNSIEPEPEPEPEPQTKTKQKKEPEPEPEPKILSSTSHHVKKEQIFWGKVKKLISFFKK
ncbi:hypothetical protein, partial [Yersinia bercovieri]|uniref:hypothetical protein n=1 Tax=Yersinia bercovieri TaxID=634 RepID=UPI0016439805